MDEFVHIRTLVGIILGLSVTHIVQSIVKRIAHPAQTKFYWVHLLWVAFLFLLIIHFWWWEFSLRAIHEWNFLKYLFLITYSILFYASTYLLLPTELDEYEDFKDYYYSRKKWFFSVIALTYVLDIIDTSLKGSSYLASLGDEYYASLAIHIILFAIVMQTKKEWVHALFASAFILYQISWIYRVYFLLE